MAKTILSRRAFFSALGTFIVATTTFFSFDSGARARQSGVSTLFDQARMKFASAIALQKYGATAEARRHAEECLELLESCEKRSKDIYWSAAGGTTFIGNLGLIVYEPNYLHTGTALQRFGYEGISL